MNRSLLISTIFCFFSSNVFAESEKLILSLTNKVGETIVSRVDFYKSQIDPNFSQAVDTFRLEVNGKSVTVPEELLHILDWSRREYSYDQFTGGINISSNKYVCMMGGVPSGSILQVRYLTYGDNSSKIVKDEMKSIYAEEKNCLFSEIIHPNKIQSEKAAVKTMAILRTILLMNLE